MSLTVKQIGQVSAQLKSQIEQFQQSLDQNDIFISQLKEHFTDSNSQLESLSNSITLRENDSRRISDSLNYADIVVNTLQQSTSSLDNDAMQTSRLWESGFTTAPLSTDYHGRSFSSGRVSFSVPSPYFDRVADRAIIESLTFDQLCVELGKIEEYFKLQLKEGRRPSEINEKVRAAMVQKINELKSSNSFGRS